MIVSSIQRYFFCLLFKLLVFPEDDKLLQNKCQLFSESYVGNEMCCPEKSFPQLRVLKLWKLEELENWIVLAGALPRLRDLEIRSCAELHELPDGLQHVTTLQELKLSNMPTKFTEWIKTKDCNGEDWGRRAHVHISIEP